MVLNLIMILNTNGYQFLFKENSSIDELGAVYLRDIGNTKIFCRNRILEFNLEMEDIGKIQNQVNLNLNLMTEICNQAESNQMCRVEIDEIKAIYQMLLDRSKIIDSVKTNRFTRDIEDIEEILQKSIILNDITYNEIKPNVDKLKEISNQVTKIQGKITNDIDYLNFNMLSEMTSFNLGRHLKFYDILFELLIEQNINNLINLVSLDEIKIELSRLQIVTGRELCSIPIELNYLEIIKYLKFAHMDIQIVKNRILITLQIPTFYKTTYNLIKAVSIPFLYKESSYVLKPIDPYHIMHKQNQQDIHAIPLSLEERNNCTMITGFILCYPLRANLLFSKTKIEKFENIFKPDFPTCLNRNVVNLEGMYDVCRLHKVPHLNQIVRLSESNFFIYLINSTKVRINCGQHYTVYNISDSFMIQDLNDDCSILLEQSLYNERKDMYFKTLYLNTPGFSTHIDKNSLIPKEGIHLVELKQSRNLQPKYINLLKETESFVSRPKTVRNIMKSSELIAIVTITFILLLATWLLTAYYFTKIQKRIDKILENPIKTDSSMSTIPPELNCRFSFLPPPIPLKKHKRNDSGEYSFPKSSLEISTTTIEIPESPNLPYTNFAKNQPTSV